VKEACSRGAHIIGHGVCWVSQCQIECAKKYDIVW